MLLLPLFLLYLPLLSLPTTATRTLNIIRFLKKRFQKNNNNNDDNNNNLQDDYLRLIATRSKDRLEDHCVNRDSLMLSPLFTML